MQPSYNPGRVEITLNVFYSARLASKVIYFTDVTFYNENFFGTLYTVRVLCACYIYTYLQCMQQISSLIGTVSEKLQSTMMYIYSYLV